MSKTIKLFSTDEKTKGISLNLPVVGIVTFDSEENFIEVEKEKGEVLLEIHFGTTLVREDEYKTARERELEEELEKVEEEKQNLENQLQDQKSKLSELGDDDLQKLLSDLPEKEKKKLSTRDKIIDYLAKMLA